MWCETLDKHHPRVVQVLFTCSEDGQVRLNLGVHPLQSKTDWEMV